MMIVMLTSLMNVTMLAEWPSANYHTPFAKCEEPTVISIQFKNDEFRINDEEFCIKNDECLQVISIYGADTDVYPTGKLIYSGLF